MSISICVKKKMIRVFQSDKANIIYISCQLSHIKCKLNDEMIKSMMI